MYLGDKTNNYIVANVRNDVNGISNIVEVSLVAVLRIGEQTKYHLPVAQFTEVSYSDMYNDDYELKENQLTFQALPNFKPKLVLLFQFSLSHDLFMGRGGEEWPRTMKNWTKYSPTRNLVLQIFDIQILCHADAVVFLHLINCSLLLFYFCCCYCSPPGTMILSVLDSRLLRYDVRVK